MQDCLQRIYHESSAININHGNEIRVLPLSSRMPRSTAHPVSSLRRFAALPACVDHDSCVTSMQDVLSTNTYTITTTDHLEYKITILLTRLPFNQKQTTHKYAHISCFSSRDIDLDPMTLIRDLDLDILKMHVHTKFLGHGFPTFEQERTDTHTDRHTQT